MDPGAVDSPVTLVIKAPNQKYDDQTINCFLNWTVEKLKSHISNVYPSKPGDTSSLHRVDQAVDYGLWNVVQLLFNGCAKFLDIGGNWNMQQCRSKASQTCSMGDMSGENAGHGRTGTFPGIVYRSLRHGAVHYAKT
uniref:HERPUD family member 2 n=1 Tax=Hucho hucho TaxID=62062 RepID=A0A4W5LDC8_9TELE